MKYLIIFVYFSFTSEGWSQIPPPLQNERYTYPLLFDKLDKVKVIPYYARFEGDASADDRCYPAVIKRKPILDSIHIGTFINWIPRISITPNLPKRLSIDEIDSVNCLFEYNTPIIAMLNDQAFAYQSFREYIKDISPPQASLNCSKIINSKGEEVYIYMNIVTGLNHFEKMNPFTAFCPYWIGSCYNSYTYHSAIVFDYDLEKGTYFFNWWDAKDSLNQIISNIWKADSAFDDCTKVVRMKLDSLNTLCHQAKSDNCNERFEYQTTTYRTRLEQCQDAPFYVECNKAFLLGYGNKVSKGEKYYFDIHRKALTTHKISNKPISPDALEQYILHPKRKRPKAIKSMLNVFKS